MPNPARVFAVSLLLSSFLVSISRAQDPEELNFRILDETSKPIEGATVVARISHDDNGPVVVQTSDADGRVHFADGTGEKKIHSVFAWKAGRIVASKRDTGSPEEKGIMVLFPVTSARIRTVDWQGNPVAGTKITFQSRFSPSRESNRSASEWDEAMRPYFSNTFETDATGWADISTVSGSSDTVSFNLEKTGYQTFSARVNLSRENGLSFRLVPSSSIQGRLIDAEGKPLPAKKIALTGNRRKAATNDLGEFEFQNLLEGTVAVQSGEENFVIPVQRLEITTSQQLKLGDLRAVSGATITGKVSAGDADIANVVRPAVRAYRREKGLESVPWKEVPVEKDGSYQIRLPAGKYTLSAYTANNTMSHAGAQTLVIEDGKTYSQDLVLNIVAAQARKAEPAPKPKPEVPDYLYGKLKDDEGKAAAEARVYLYQGKNLIAEGKAKADGGFTLGPLIGAVSPAGDVRPVLTTTPNSPPLYVWARLPGLVAPPTPIDLADNKPLDLTLQPTQPLQLKVVTTQGEPIANARISTRKWSSFSSPSPEAPRLELKSGDVSFYQNQLTTDAQGRAVFSDVPPGFLELRVEREGFASFDHVVAAPRNAPVVLKLSREAIIEGNIIWDGGRPFGFKGSRVKAQAWGSYELWRTGDVDANGHFEIRDLPTKDMMGTGISLDLIANGSKKLGPGNRGELEPGLTAESMEQGRNFNLLVKEEKDGQERRWISYVQSGPSVPKYKEGERTKFDVILHSMAHVRGKVIIPEGTPMPEGLGVSYDDPRNTFGYQISSVKVMPDGRFDVWLPSLGDITLRLKVNERTASGRFFLPLVVKDLKPHELREVEWDLRDNSPLQTSKRFTSRTFRLLGPDGATAPRVPITVRSQDGRSSITAISDLVGNAFFGSEPELQSPSLESAYLEASIPYASAPQTLKLKSMPNGPFANQVFSPYMMGTRDLEDPGPSKIGNGEFVPELKVNEWLLGGPVKLANLRGKVVLISFGEYFPNLAELRNAYPTATFIQLVRAPQAAMNSDRPQEKTFDAIGIDPEISNSWLGYNSRILGSESSPVLIDVEGKFAGRDLPARYLKARLEQLLEQIPAGP